jgi:hypothetical protein
MPQGCENGDYTGLIAALCQRRIIFGRRLRRS